MESQSLNSIMDRVNRLIVKNSLPVPRLVSNHFINYQFWSIVFTNLFRIKCNPSIRSMSQRCEMINCCLNTLETLIGSSLDHIKPIRLLSFDNETMSNLLEIAEVWSDNVDEENNENELEPSIHQVSISSSFNKSEPSIVYLEESQSKANELATLLLKALKNQIIALEIEKKIKSYLGDVTTKKPVEGLRASRQSIVRTRTYQPMATFDFNFNRKDKRNSIFSGKLEKWFPELSTEKIHDIRKLEANLLMIEQSTNIKKPKNIIKTNFNLNYLLNTIIIQQRERIEMFANKEQQSSGRFTIKRQAVLQREYRTQRAILHDEINKFYKSATASYLNARSYLESILVEEFRKVESHQHNQIHQIKKYLKDHEENLNLDKVRAMLETIEQLCF